MSSLLSATQWAQVKSVLRDAADTFFMRPIIWKKSLGSLDVHGEDSNPIRFETRTLLGLIEYDYFKKWTTQGDSSSGALDNQNQVLLLNKQYLEENNYLNANGNLDFNPDADRFIDAGITYKSIGHTDVSQAQVDPFLYMLILTREETNTGSNAL